MSTKTLDVIKERKSMKTISLFAIILLVAVPVYSGSKNGMSSKGSSGMTPSPHGKVVPYSSYKTQNVYDQYGQLKEVIRKNPSGNLNLYNQYGQLQQVIRKDSSGSQNVYNQKGQLQEVVKKDPSGGEKIYNQYGQLQNVIRKDTSGNLKIYDQRGQLQGYIRNDGTIMNQYGQSVGRIKPGN